MTIAYDLSQLNPITFENMVNMLALRVLGPGSTGFGPGADGGRNGYFEGTAPYPSVTDCWSGVWYIQSKFFNPGGQKNEHAWLIERVKAEIKLFETDYHRTWPDNWIIATNVDVGGKPETGSFDSIRQLLSESSGKHVRLAIWGGQKILDLLSQHRDIGSSFGHFLTPGNIISKLYEELASLTESRATLEEIIRYFVVTQFSENTYTKLEQAGSSSDLRPTVHDLFIDLPYKLEGTTRRETSNILAKLTSASAQPQKYSVRKTIPESWREWSRLPQRARVTLIKGGPGQGKSTIGQYLCQIQRAHFILAADGPKVIEDIYSAAGKLREIAQADRFWPTSPRIPVQIELKDYAHWHSQRHETMPRTVTAYLAELVGRRIGAEVSARGIKLAFSKQSWLVVFDGLDEVPNDHKDEVSREVVNFINDVLVEIDGDVLSLCTSRPQGYSGQFAKLDGAEVSLARLNTDTALKCAIPLLRFRRGADEAEKSVQTLESAIKSPNIQELMTTPLQSHIMAVVIRDGGRPPERRWRLFQSFYLVMKKRESLKGFKDPRIAELLQGEDRLLKAVHMRLGFVLHARAERSSGANTALTREEFKQLVEYVVNDLVTEDIEETVQVLMEATTERLVLVSTPDNGNQIRFDIRQLQEFFAAEFLYDGAELKQLACRIEAIGADSHWREVMHFLLSALIADRRTTELTIAIDELRKFNEGVGDCDDGLLQRRLARGTLVALRLLCEGVVEGDQKDRRSIKSLIADLGGVLDLQTVAQASYLSARNSKQWLIKVLLERVSLTTSTEHIGALFLLGILLPHEADESKDLLAAVEVLTSSELKILVKHWSRLLSWSGIGDGAGDSDARFSRWVMIFIIQFLNSERWLSFSAEVTSDLLAIAKSCKRTFLDACADLAMPSDMANDLYRCAIESNDAADNISGEESTLPCGILKALPIAANWMSARPPSQFVDINSELYVNKFFGFFHYAFVCLWFGQSRTPNAFNRFVEVGRSMSLEHCGLLPKVLLALVPVSNDGGDYRFGVAHLTPVKSAEELDSMFERLNEKILPISDRYRMSGSYDEDAWDLASKKIPQLAIAFALDPEESPFEDRVIISENLAELMRERPDLMAEWVLRWGQIGFSHSALLEDVKRSVGDQASVLAGVEIQIRRGHKLYPFSINLPTDQNLLPILAASLLSWDKGPKEIETSIELSPDASGFEEGVLEMYGLSIHELRAVATNSSQPKLIRAGALGLYWFSQQEMYAPLELEYERKLYEEVVDSFSKKWLTQALVNGVLRHKRVDDTHVAEFVNSLLSDDISQELIPLFEIWRERSLAPITTRNVLASWLGYSDTVPAYAR